METEIVNITKIKDGFFLGDENTAINIDVIVQFKISHIINSAGPQVQNAWENIHIKYLTLNWDETPKQTLFDPKDEIANRIVGFIDDSSKNGEGFLVHSVKGQNRACLVVLIYLIRKFRWSLKKSLEFLASKKNDIFIPNYFLSQLNAYEDRLFKIGQGPNSNSWNEISTGNMNDIDNEEVLIRNTFVNSTTVSSLDNFIKSNKSTLRKVVWSDQTDRRSLIMVSNRKDLLVQKDIKPIIMNKKMLPGKGCLKTTKKSLSNNNLINLSKGGINSVSTSLSTNEIPLSNKFSNLGGSMGNNVMQSNLQLNQLNQNPSINKMQNEQKQLSQSSNQINPNVKNQNSFNTNTNYQEQQQQEYDTNSYINNLNILNQQQNKIPKGNGFLRDHSLKKKDFNKVKTPNINHLNHFPLSGVNTLNNVNSYGINDLKPNTPDNPQKMDFTSKFGGDNFHSNNNSNNYNEQDNQKNKPLRPNSVDSKTKEFINNSSKNSNNSIVYQHHVQNVIKYNVKNIYITPSDDIKNIIPEDNNSKPPHNIHYDAIVNQKNPSRILKSSDNQRPITNNYFKKDLLNTNNINVIKKEDDIGIRNNYFNIGERKVQQNYQGMLNIGNNDGQGIGNNFNNIDQGINSNNSTLKRTNNNTLKKVNFLLSLLIIDGLLLEIT